MANTNENHSLLLANQRTAQYWACIAMTQKFARDQSVEVGLGILQVAAAPAFPITSPAPQLMASSNNNCM